MSSHDRPLSPFMLGPYYKPQLTSVMSISHRLTGLLLSFTGLPLLTLWLIALADDAASFGRFMDFAGSWPVLILWGLNLFALFYHLLNGIRHLLWDAGWLLDLKGAYASGWTVVVLSVLLTVLTLGVLL